MRQGMITKWLSVLVSVGLILSACPIPAYASTAETGIGVNVEKVYDADIVLAVGDSSQSVTGFKEDLEAALVQRGMEASRIRISSVETQETSILSGVFKLNLYWPNVGVDMDAHMEFWDSTSKVDELSYSKKDVYGSTLDNDDRTGGTGEWITINFDTVPAEITQMRVYINPYSGTTNATMFLYRILNEVNEKLIESTKMVSTKSHFGDFIRNEDSWDFHYSDGTVFSGTEVQITSRDFLEVIREPDWNDSAKHYLVNLNDATIPDFDNAIALGEIVTRMGNDEIHYIGWGDDADGSGTTDNTGNQAQEFIRMNSNLGTFVNRSGQTYAKQIDDIADYIFGRNANEAVADVLTLGSSYDLQVTPPQEAGDTIDADWPSGKWRIKHDPDVYENNDGIVPYDGVYLNHLVTTFDRVGQYDIYYKDTLVKTLYVHRKPVSLFDVAMDEEFQLSFTDLSYDLDSRSQESGIADRVWQWKRTTDAEWTEGTPASFSPGENYIIQLKVQDDQGDWSVSQSRYQSTAPGTIKPIADFRIVQPRLSWPNRTLDIRDISYDPRNMLIADKQWKVFDGTTEIYSGNTPKIDFSDVENGVYKISHRLQNSDGTWSEWLSRFVTIGDWTGPTVTAVRSGTSPGYYKAGENIVLTLQWDEPVIVNGTPRVKLNFGTDRYAMYTEGTGTSMLTFTYTIQDNDMVDRVDVASPNALETSGGSIRDGESNPAVLLLPRTVVDLGDIGIDGVRPDKPAIESSFVRAGVGVTIISGAPAAGETAWLAPSGTTVFTAGTTMTRLDGDGSRDDIAAPSAQGEYKLFIIDQAGNISELSDGTITVDNTPPGQPVMESPVAGDGIINMEESRDVRLSGSAEPYAHIEVLFADVNTNTVTASVYADMNGKWVFPGDSALDVSTLGDGTITVAVNAADRAGNRGPATIQTVLKDTILPGDQDQLLPEDRMIIGGHTMVLNSPSSGGAEDRIYIAPPGMTAQQLTANDATITAVSGDQDEIPAPFEEGSYKLYVLDEAGNLSTPSRASILVDNTPPVITGLQASTTEWTNSDVGVTSMIHDGAGSGVSVTKYVYGNQPMDYFISGGHGFAGNRFTVSENGVYTIYAGDLAGNGSIQTVEVSNIDKNKPSAPIIVRIPDRDFYNDGFRFSVMPGVDRESGVTDSVYRMSGAVTSDWTVYTGPFDITAAGFTKVEVKTFDRAGNVSDTAESVIHLNREITVFPTLMITPDTLYSNKDYTVSIRKEFDPSAEAEALYSEVYYKLGPNGEFTLYRDPFMIESEGQIDITVKVVDRSGNESTITRTVHLDKSAPTTQDGLLERSFEVQGGALISIQPTGDSTDSVWLAPLGTTVFIEGSTMKKVSGDKTSITAPSQEGEYRLYVIDRSGNISEPSRAAVIVDNTGPTVGGVEAGKTYKVYPEITFTEGTATLNGKPAVSGVVADKNGTYELIVTDIAGNRTVIHFTVDNDEESVKKDADLLQLEFAPDNHKNRVYENIKLATEGKYGSRIEWSSSDESLVSIDGTVAAPGKDTEVTLTATISKGDSSIQMVFTVKVVNDPIKPTLTLLGEPSITLEKGQLYLEKGFKAIDNKDGDISGRVKISGFVDTERTGMYKLIYTITDAAGNKAEAERIITVVNETVPSEAVIAAKNNEKISEADLNAAIQGAKERDKDKVKIVVNEVADTDRGIQVSLSKEQVEAAKRNNLKLELETGNTAIVVPIQAIDLAQLNGYSRLALSVTQVDTAAAENRAMVEAVKQVNPNMGIFDNKVFDFKMKVIEEDNQGQIISEQEIHDFRSETDISLRIFIGKDINDEMKFMTFYFNPSSGEWEYIRGQYDTSAGEMTLLTNHLSIYSVMSLTKQQKQEEMAKIMNKPGITVREAMNVIEDSDMDFEQAALSQYATLTKTHREAVAELLIERRPNSGYDYALLVEQYTVAVNDKYTAIHGDSEEPVITLVGPAYLVLEEGDIYTERGAAATDDQDGNITGRIMLIGSVDTSRPGTYVLRYVVQDVKGNQSEILRMVVVERRNEDPAVPAVKDTKNGRSSLLEVVKGKDDLKVEEADLSALGRLEKGMKLAGDRAFNITVHSMDGYLDGIIRMKYDPNNVTNENHLAVYVYNENNQRWESIGGIVDKVKHEITVAITSSSMIALMEFTREFPDLKGHWAKDIVELLAARQIIDGDSNGNYNPNLGISRAEFATIIAKSLKLPTEESRTGFADIDVKSWYAPYVAAARKAGIVNGISETEYEPDRVVTREEMAAMVIRAVKQWKNVSISAEDLARMERFADNDEISDWAYNDVYTAKHLQLVVGRDGLQFAPDSKTLRGEAAMLIYNFLKAIGEM
jgi:hypothetical protein